MFDSEDDPRLTDEHVRTVRVGKTRLTLVGVIHDHPASTYRVGEVIRRRTPDVLAVELPPLAVPLFCEYARDARTPPAFGGEMSAAIQAAEGAPVVGIDGPSRSFVRLLVRTLVREGTSPGTLRDVVEAMAIASKTAVASRVAATLASTTGVWLEIGEPWTYDVDWTDAPADQATDERDHLARARALSSSLIPPAATQIRDEVREAHMVERLRETASRGELVAVVGRDHLDPIADELATP